MKFINFAVVKFSVFLLFGILAAHYSPIPFLALKLLILVLCLTGILWFVARNQLFQQPYFGISAYLCFFLIGYFSYQIRLPEFQPKHYSHFVTDDESQLLQIKIIQSLKPDKYNQKYFANVSAINGTPTTGEVLVNVSKDSLFNTFPSDEILVVYTSVSEVPKPLNPHQFDYSQYLKSQGVYGQLRISDREVIHIWTGRKTIFGTAQNMRSEIVKKLEAAKLKRDERAIIQALILGEKKDIDKTLYSEYAAAGAVHILAVSGLHVAILYTILFFLFKPLARLKFGIYLQVVLVVGLLWGFAVLSGLSPSVTRAVTMFTFFAFAKVINRRTNSINTLFLSLLTLLIINPMWLFQVSFQLSYLAVFFIVWLQPIVYGIGYSKYWIVRKIWGIASVTICAQIGVLPLSLYYFHQFPGLFLLTNIVILPFLTILMCGGLLIVFLAIFNRLPDWLSEVYNSLIEGLNRFVHWIAVQDEFLFKEIHFSTLKVVGTYLLIVTGVLFIKKYLKAGREKSYHSLSLSLFSVLVFIAIFIYEDFKTSANEFLIFQKTGKTLISYKVRNKMIVFKTDPTLNHMESFPIKPYRIGLNIQHYSEENLPKIFRYNKKSILVLDSLGIIPNKRTIHTVILTESPRVNLVRLIDSLNPKQIIADGSNYYSYAERWKRTCQIKKLPFHHTAKQGAFSIE